MPGWQRSMRVHCDALRRRLTPSAPHLARRYRRERWCAGADRARCVMRSDHRGGRGRRRRSHLIASCNRRSRTSHDSAIAQQRRRSRAPTQIARALVGLVGDGCHHGGSRVSGRPLCKPAVADGQIVRAARHP